MKIYTIIGGVNGVGKSSLTGALKPIMSDFGYIIDVDNIAKENKLSNLNAGKIAINKINNFIENGITFTQESTLSGVRTEKTIKKAKEKGYYIRLFYIGLESANESIERIQNRVKDGGHHIDDTDVIRRFKNRFESLIKILPFCDEVKFYDNQKSFNSIAEYKNGEIVFTSNYRPKWIEDLSLLMKRIDT